MRRTVRWLTPLLALVSVVPAARGTLVSPPPLVPPGYLALVGPLHEHSGYSDGYPGSTPATYYASAAAFGNDFLMSGEHSDTLDAPIVANEECVGPALPSCALADPDPAKTLRKWDAMAEHAKAATTETFTGVRGFEWSSDRFGHVDVYFSSDFTNAKADGGYATMATFYRWLAASDGLATFNHPDAKKLNTADPERNWNDLAYVPAVDQKMVGIEVYNDDRHFGDWYTRALDRGWHVGAIGAEDLGHKRGDDWGGPGWAKTVILSVDRSPAALRAAMLARRFYAIRYPDVRLAFTVDDALMGSRLARPAGATLNLAAQATGRDDLTLEVVTSGGRVVATGTGTLAQPVTAAAADRYYFLRVRQGDEVLGYSSPVWVSAAKSGHVGEWLAGDLHVHTCYSHDAYCGPDDHNTGPDEAYTLGGSPAERFAEASLRGLDYLALTDHHSDRSPQDSGYRSVDDPGFGTSGVVGVRGYENSIAGHAQMLGAQRIYPAGDQQAADVAAMADALRADGGVFQANHPADDLDRPLTSCADLSGMHWRYGLTVPVDTVEVWNIGHHVQPPAPAGTSNADAVFYWECWLSRGAHVAATGGSDSHWLSTAAVQGVGNPTTWVFAAERSERGVLDALRAGRTSITFRPPVEGSTPLLLEADTDGDGTYEAMAGDTVRPGTPMRVTGGTGLVEVRANGRTVVSGAPLVAGGDVRFTLDEPGWVRAELYAEDGREARRASCEPVLGGETTYCRNRVGLLALTSPLYVGEEPEPSPSPTLSPSPALCPSGTPKPRPSGNPNGDKCK